MLERILVDSLDVRRQNAVAFKYVFENSFPSIRSYAGIVEDFFQTTSGNGYLRVNILSINNRNVSSFPALFSVNNIVRDSLIVEV